MNVYSTYYTIDDPMVSERLRVLEELASPELESPLEPEGEGATLGSGGTGVGGGGGGGEGTVFGASSRCD